MLWLTELNLAGQWSVGGGLIKKLPLYRGLIQEGGLFERRGAYSKYYGIYVFHVDLIFLDLFRCTHGTVSLGHTEYHEISEQLRQSH